MQGSLECAIAWRHGGLYSLFWIKCLDVQYEDTKEETISRMLFNRVGSGIFGCIFGESLKDIRKEWCNA